MWETWSLGGGCRRSYGHGHGRECVPGDQVRVVKVGLHGEEKKTVVAQAVSFHPLNSQALGESPGLRAWLGLADPQAGPWACQSRHQGPAQLRLLGLGCLGFQALSRAVQNTIQEQRMSLRVLLTLSGGRLSLTRIVCPAGLLFSTGRR